MMAMDVDGSHEVEYSPMDCLQQRWEMSVSSRPKEISGLLQLVVESLDPLKSPGCFEKSAHISQNTTVDTPQNHSSTSRVAS